MFSGKSPMPPAARAVAMPLRIGGPEEFARVSGFLRDMQFDERTVTEALKIPSISRLRDTDISRVDRATVPPDLLTLIELLIGGDAVASNRLRAFCDDTTFSALTSLDLIRDVDGSDVVCPIWLYPVQGFLIASDRKSDPNGAFDVLSNEVVFPAHDSGTLHLLKLLPRPRGGDALELCGGSGIGALQLARSGMRAVAIDITSRSAHFAAFNAELNGLEVESLCGDLYSPVAGRRFDLICAHPPWVPSTGDAMIFRDGGDTGEAILQNVIAGIPGHLSPDGTGILVSLGRDGTDASFQQRVRGWLGDAGRDCDVIVGVDKTLSIDNLIASMRELHLNGDGEKADRMARRFRELGTERFVYGAVFIHRTGTLVAEPPLRLQMSNETTAPDFERIFAWRRFRRSAGFADWMAAAVPRLPPDLELNIRHIVRNGAMIEDSAILMAKRPLSVPLRSDVWAARMLALFDARRTVAQVFDAVRQADRMPGNFTPTAFLDFLSQVIERGLLDVDVPQG